MTSTVTTGTVTSVDGTTIAFERSGHGPALVLVDGAGCHRAAGPMRPLAALLSDDFTVHTYDRRGRGQSGDTQPYDSVCEVEDLAAIIDVAGGRAALYGASSGALLALRAAADCGVTIPRLALFEPPIGDGGPDGGDDTTAVVTELLAAGRRGDAAEHDLDLLRQVRVPTLVIHRGDGADDPPAWARAVVAALPDGRHRSLPGRWHDAPAETVAAVLTEFLLH